MARSLRRHRTVLCRLVPEGVPFGQPGPVGPWPCPLSSRTPGFLHAGHGHDHPGGDDRGRPGGVGSSPTTILRSPPATPSPSPGSVPEPPPADHHRRGLMAADGNRPRGRFVQWLTPVLCRPPGGPGGVDRHHPQPRVGRHADQEVAELPRRQAGHAPAKPLAAGAAAHGLAALLAGGSKVEVLDDQAAAAVGGGQPERLAGPHHRS